MSAQVDLSVGIPIDIKEFFDMPSEVDIAKRELLKVLHELAASIVHSVNSMRRCALSHLLHPLASLCG